MLTRAHRFHGYNSLDTVYRQGTTVRGPFTMLRYIQNTKRNKYRCAVVVSKKVHKSAVVRNRIRRRIYEIVRRHDNLPTLDIVITVFDESAATMPAPQLVSAIEKQLRSIKSTPVV